MGHDSLRADLLSLARNFRWTWSAETRAVFDVLAAACGPSGAAHWSAAHRDPLALVRGAGDAALAAFAEPAGREALERARAAAADAAPLDQPLIAYFSPEFGVSESLPQYSGGLGVLAGDHLKAASDLGTPLVGVGLFYDEGYFAQTVDASGRQRESYPKAAPDEVGVRDTGVEIEVEVAGGPTRCRVWLAEVGRVSLYLLDTASPANPARRTRVTDRLYGGDVEHRLHQEIVLGMGGARALRALGLAPAVYHLNEGHAGFLALERIGVRLAEHGGTLAEAVAALAPSTVFTTHTPVPAGIDRFPRALFETAFAGWAQRHGVAMDELLSLGREPGAGADGPFNMAWFCLRVSGAANGVSKLHGHVSRDMFTPLRSKPSPRLVWPTPEIGSVTNGVHAPTWTAPAVAALFERVVGDDWASAPASRWAAVHELSDDEVRAARAPGFAALASVARRVRPDALDEGALTIGFSRRFATYKRAALLLSDPERLRKLLLHADRPVQFVWAGKAHPADEGGKAVLAELARFAAADPDCGRRFVVVEGYDMGIARAFYHGSDVWLNTPRRPLEACGTSGQKAAFCGALNCSILDGWWDELYDGANGWAIPSAEEQADDARRDALEAAALFDLLEREVIPLFYEDGPVTPSARWCARIRHAWQTLCPEVSAARMVRDYDEQVYQPALRRVR